MKRATVLNIVAFALATTAVIVSLTNIALAHRPTICHDAEGVTSRGTTGVLSLVSITLAILGAILFLILRHTADEDSS